MVEVEGLKVVIAAEIRDAIENIKKVNDAFSNLTAKIKIQAPYLDAFLKKWKIGWVTTGVAAIASLYALAKSSAYMSLWFAEASGVVGYFMDSALEPLQPLFDVISKALWKFADAFAKLPESIRGAVGAIILAIGGLATSITGLKIIDLIFGTDFTAKLIAFVKSAFHSVGGSILGAIAAGIGVGVTVVWILDKLGIIKAINDAGRTIEEKIPEIWQIVKWLTAPLAALGSIVINLVRGNFDQILPDLKRILWDETFLKAWNFVKEMLQKTPILGKALVSAGLLESPPRGYQTGTSFVPETGLYTLHRGEAVVPRGKSISTGNPINFSPTINILNPQIKSDMDVRQLANQLTSYWRDDMQRYVRGVVA